MSCGLGTRPPDSHLRTASAVTSTPAACNRSRNMSTVRRRSSSMARRRIANRISNRFERGSRNFRWRGDIVGTIVTAIHPFGNAVVGLNGIPAICLPAVVQIPGGGRRRWGWIPVVIVLVAVLFAVSRSRMSRPAGTCPFCGGTAVPNSAATGMAECLDCHREFPSWMADPQFAKQAREQAQRELEIERDMDDPTE